MEPQEDRQELAQASPTEPPAVELGKFHVQLVEPPSLFAFAVSRSKDRVEAGGLAGTLAHGAAALRMCWPDSAAWPVRVRPRPWRLGSSVSDYGSEIWEELRRGTKGVIPFSALNAAVIAAHNYAVGSALTDLEVAEVEDFSQAQAEG